MCFPLNCCQTRKVRSTFTEHTTPHIQRKCPLKVGGLNMSHVDYDGPRIIIS